MKSVVKKQRCIYLEILRIISIFLVVFNHTHQSGFQLFLDYSPKSIIYWVYLFLSIFCVCAVPVFFMISGALLLGKTNEPIKVLWKKRILRFFIDLFVFSVLYYFFNNDFNLNFFTIFYTDGSSYHLWYLYAYLAFLIGLPILREFVCRLQPYHYYYIFAIAFVCLAIVPIAEYIVFKGTFEGKSIIFDHLRLDWLSRNIVIYPLIGYFLHNKFDIKKLNAKKLILMWLINIILILITEFLTYKYSEVQRFHSKFVIINATVLYITIKFIFENKKIPEKIQGIICSLGECTFGIYLLHIFIEDSWLFEEAKKIMFSTGLNQMVCVLILCLALIIFLWGIVFVLKRIPIIRKLF